MPLPRLFTASGLAGQIALVTGGSRGIGRAIVEALAAEGAVVTFWYVADETAAAAAVAAVRAGGGTVDAERVDVRDGVACARAVDRLGAGHGRIDVLVNNAGVVRDNLLGALTDAEVHAVLDTNVAGVFNVTRPVVPYMIRQRAGVIVNVSSVAADRGGRGQTTYAASKGAVNAFTRALAVELAPRRVRVNAVAPGIVETDMSADVRERAGEAVRARIPLGQYGTPADVAAAVVFLASRHAAYVTGQVLRVDGGVSVG